MKIAISFRITAEGTSWHAVTLVSKDFSCRTWLPTIYCAMLRVTIITGCDSFMCSHLVFISFLHLFTEKPSSFIHLHVTAGGQRISGSLVVLRWKLCFFHRLLTRTTLAIDQFLLHLFPSSSFSSASSSCPSPLSASSFSIGVSSNAESFRTLQ